MPWLTPGDTLVSNVNPDDLENLMPDYPDSWTALSPSENNWPAVSITLPDELFQTGQNAMPLTRIKLIGAENIQFVILEVYDAANQLQELIDEDGTVHENVGHLPIS